MNYKQIAFITLSLLLTTTASHIYSMHNPDQEKEHPSYLTPDEISDAETEQLCDLFEGHSLDDENDELAFLNSDTIKKERNEQQLFERLICQRELYAELAGLVTQQKRATSLPKKCNQIIEHCKLELKLHAWRVSTKERLNQKKELQQNFLPLNEKPTHTEARLLEHQKTGLEKKSLPTTRRSLRKRKKPATPYNS